MPYLYTYFLYSKSDFCFTIYSFQSWNIPFSLIIFWGNFSVCSAGVSSLKHTLFCTVSNRFFDVQLFSSSIHPIQVGPYVWVPGHYNNYIAASAFNINVLIAYSSVCSGLPLYLSLWSIFYFLGCDLKLKNM